MNDLTVNGTRFMSLSHITHCMQHIFCRNKKDICFTILILQIHLLTCVFQQLLSTYKLKHYIILSYENTSFSFLLSTHWTQL